MERTIYRWAGILALAIFLLSGCSESSITDDKAGGSTDRVEVYYRDFDTLAPIRYSAEELIRSATFKTVLTDRKSIESIHELTALPCTVDQEVSKDQVDLYLLIHEYSEKKLTRTWAASKFHFLEWPGDSNRPCKLNSTDRDVLQRMLATIK